MPRYSRFAFALTAVFAAAAVSHLHAGFAGTDLFLPSVGRAAGVADWYTTVWVHNPEPSPAKVQFFFLERDQANPSPMQVMVNIPPGETVRYVDALGELFDTDGFGAIRVVSNRSLLVTSRIFSKADGDTDDDSKGQDLPGIPASFAIGAGERTEILGVYQTQPASSSDFRTNYGFVETTGSPCTVQVTPLDGAGAPLATSKTYTMRAFEQRQVQLSLEFPSVSTTNARLEVRVTSGTGRVIAFGSSIANRSQDPTTFEMQFRDALLGGGEVVHDGTLMGDGTNSSPLGVADLRHFQGEARGERRQQRTGSHHRRCVTALAAGRVVVAVLGRRGARSRCLLGDKHRRKRRHRRTIADRVTSVRACRRRGVGGPQQRRGGRHLPDRRLGRLTVRHRGHRHDRLRRRRLRPEHRQRRRRGVQRYGQGRPRGRWRDRRRRGHQQRRRRLWRATTGNGVYGESESGYAGRFDGRMRVEADTPFETDGFTVANTGGGRGLRVTSTTDTALWAVSTSGAGIDARSTSGNGITATSSTGYAGYFFGKVAVTGPLTKLGGGFKIDHPLDPSGMYLYHSFVESPDMKNIYDGVVTTDEDGRAVIELPEWFEALNRDFRYQLTVIGRFAQAIVEEEIANNSFTIRTDMGGVKVSWQVTGIRRDAWADANRLPVEEVKPDDEQGTYLNPEAFGLGEEWSLEAVVPPPTE